MTGRSGRTPRGDVQPALLKDRTADAESTSAALAHVTAERDELAETIRSHVEDAASRAADLRETRDALADVRDQLANAARRGWIVARHGGRDCAACDQEIVRDMAYTYDPTTEEPIHIHCP